MKKKIIALCLALVLVLACLWGCGSGSTAEEDADSSADSSEESTDEIPQEAFDDVIAYLTDGAVCIDDVVYVVDGADMTAGEFFYWLTYEAYIYSYSYYSSYYYYPDLTAEMSDGTTIADYVLEDAYYYACFYACIYAHAVDDGVTLTDTYQSSLDSYISDAAYDLGESAWETAVAAGTVSEDDYTDEEKEAWIEEEGEYEMNLYLMYYATDQDGLYDVYLRNYYYQQYEDVLYGEGGDYEVTEDDIEAYIEENEIYSCRYILFGDADGDFDDDELEEYYEEALACYEELLELSGTSLDTAISAYAVNNSDGNSTGELAFDSSDTVLDEFLEVLEGLEIGEIGMTGETEDGYYVIIRDEAEADTELTSDTLTVLDHYIEEAFAEVIADWYEEMEVTDTGVLDDFDVNEFFDNLDALRELIDL